MIKKILKITAILLACAYLIAAQTVLNRKPQGNVCQHVRCVVTDSIPALFINRYEVEAILKRNHLHPLGRMADSVSCQRIENCLLQDPRVAAVECFKSPTHNVSIRVMQKVPLLRIIDNTGDSYFIDSNGEVMRAPGCPAHLIVVTGNVPKKMVKQLLYPLAQFLNEDKFWNAQIEQIHITPANEIELVPRIGDHIIFLGKPAQLEHKLAQLKTFYTKGLNKVGWNKYSRISLEFNNQIICTKKEK